ncbi:HAD family hydrolase [Geothrix sp. 21YS21S-2]|uniref:KdsC family phosphatase n=1 Tax=Geothrix sp. 21YS21S-2 TaxID=3068893 RepID=UPI0027BA7B44|nr:HAD hydrolase family protein [Geothrix sp. 21YS21S-2]
MTSIEERARAIRLVCTDVDGVLTTGALVYGTDPRHTKAFNVRDGAGIKWLQRFRIPVAFISGLDSPATIHRAWDLKVEDCFVGHLAKKPVLDQLCAKYGLAPEEVAHVGDDLADLPLLTRVGLACCPRDAVAEVRAACHLVVPVDGGAGVVRAVAEAILRAQGHWDEVVASY